MSKRISFFNFSLSKIVSGEYSILDNARIRLLYYGLIISICALIALIGNIYYQHLFFLTITNSVLLVSALVLFKMLTYKPNWRVIANVILIIGTFINLLDVYIPLQNVDAITIEIIIMIVLFSFYMLGQKLGLFYSALNVVPIVVLMVLQFSNSYVINLKPEKVEESTVIICILVSFILIIFIHSHFYNAFLKSIRQLKQTSEEQIALNHKYEIAIEKAEKSFEAKSEFLSTMSHEIRTPLNAVIGMSNLLIMGGPRPDQKENLEVLKFSAGNLLSIVNDVLDFNKIESGTLVFENTRFNLVELMQSICGGQMIAAQEKDLKFNLDIDNTFSKKILFGDPTRITQVIFNLMSNAIKFTQQGQIWVKATCLEDRHNTVTVNFSVKDTGIGIAQREPGCNF
jgi:signal transduction histidine kinase